MAFRWDFGLVHLSEGARSTSGVITLIDYQSGVFRCQDSGGYAFLLDCRFFEYLLVAGSNIKGGPTVRKR